MLITDKVQDVLASSEYVKSIFASKYTKGLTMLGKTNAAAGTYYNMLIYSLSLPNVTGELQLELYKRTKALLTTMNIVPKTGNIAEEQPIVNAWVFFGSAEKDLADSTLQNALNSAYVGITSMGIEYNPSHQVYYFAYPAELDPLGSIKDQNQFLTLADWKTHITTFNVEGEDVDYRVYEFKHYTTQTGFTNYFNF